MDSKKWFTSKTVWANVFAVGVLISSKFFGYTIPADYEVYFLGLVNIILRFITKSELVA